MDFRPVLDFLFPAQCAGCNALGIGLCFACAPPAGEPVRMRLRLISVLAYGAYEGALRAAILALKDGRRDVAEALANRIAPLVPPGAILVPIPTTAKRERVRGIDGVRLVAQRAADLAGSRLIPALTQLRGDAQRGRTRGERLAARGRFVCDADLVNKRRIMLIDDVCTTGATLEDGQRAVAEAGGIVAGAVVVAATKAAPPWNPKTLR